MGVGPQADLAHRASKVGKGEPREVQAQGQGIDKVTDEAFELLVAAVGDGGADEQVVLAAVATQQGLRRPPAAS